MILLFLQVTINIKAAAILIVCSHLGLLAKVLTGSWQSLDPLVLPHMHHVAELACAWWPCTLDVQWPSWNYLPVLGMPAGQLPFSCPVLSRNPRQLVCTGRLRSIREEGNASKSTQKLGILVCMEHILKIQGNRYRWYGWRWETPYLLKSVKVQDDQ